MMRRPPRSTRTDTLFPYTTLFRSDSDRVLRGCRRLAYADRLPGPPAPGELLPADSCADPGVDPRHRLHPDRLDDLLLRARRWPARVAAAAVGDLLGPRLRHPFTRTQNAVERRVGTDHVSPCSATRPPYHK